MDYTKLNELKSQYGDYEEVFNSGDYDKVYIMIADAQALTDNAEHPEKVRQNIIQVALDYLACGLVRIKYGCVLIILWNIIYMRAILSHRKKYLCQSFQLQNITGLMLIYA